MRYRNNPEKHKYIFLKYKYLLEEVNLLITSDD